MEHLKKKIIEDGKIISGDILKVDSFLNHQLDPNLMRAIGVEFTERFKTKKITKILTLEASGIAVALATAMCLNIPVVFAKKQKPSTLTEAVYSSKIHSYTKNQDVTITVSADYLQENDRVLIIDDFLATGAAAKGMMGIIEQAGAELVGIGIVIEKTFRGSGNDLRGKGIELESLVKISNIEEGKITFE